MIWRLLLPDIPTSMFYFNLLFLSETITDIARRLVSDTGVVSLARFPTGGAVLVGIKWIAEVTAVRWSCLCASLVGRHFYCNKKIWVETQKTHKDIKYSKNTYPVLPKIIERYFNRLSNMAANERRRTNYQTILLRYCYILNHGLGQIQLSIFLGRWLESCGLLS